MFMSMTLLAFLVTLCQHKTYTTCYQMKIHRWTLNEDGDQASEHRWSRSTFQVWPQAIRALLKKARRVPTTSRSNEKYLMAGIKGDAVRDFQTLKLTFPDGKAFSHKGVLDGVRVRLYTIGRSQSSNSILIQDPKSGNTVKIMYYKKVY